MECSFERFQGITKSPKKLKHNNTHKNRIIMPKSQKQKRRSEQEYL